MSHRSYELRKVHSHVSERRSAAHLRLSQAIDAFIAVADVKFGPITKIRRKGLPPKLIPWAAFQLSEDDWKRVKLCADILADAHLYQQSASSSRSPTLHVVIPALETLSSRWEAKEKKPKYAIYRDALKKALEKLLKYYTKLDDARAYILALYLHPYYKLLYIEEQWGGEDDFFAGLEDRNWQAFARKTVEDTLKEYWPKRFQPPTANTAQPSQQGNAPNDANAAAPAAPAQEEDDDGDFDRVRRRRLLNADSEDGWKVEMRRYEDDPAVDETKDTDTVKYWAVGLSRSALCRCY
ncbi:hypothetical protein OH76DRAFT_1356891 [Lentinus brumalis]|uniref:Uncharacterized protein n=1 Tax=Lentinus brumalis TaxID=2498619 RepID=A0A371D0D2_9APHY|nr:hypothetical protein OH76DRAFT_1356891 [Polyporus brumalis]